MESSNIQYQAGGVFLPEGHDWTREQIDRKYIYRFIPEKEGGLLYYYNCRQELIDPRSKMVNDTRMSDIHWEILKMNL